MEHLKKLEELGYIEIKRRSGRGNRYIVRSTGRASTTGSGSATGRASTTGTSRASTTGTSRAGATGPVAPARPEPSGTGISNHQEKEPSAAEQAVAADALSRFGIISKKQLRTLLAIADPETIIGWSNYTATQRNLTNPAGYLISQLQSGDPPPSAPELGEEDPNSYEALKRRYVPSEYEHIIEY